MTSSTKSTGSTNTTNIKRSLGPSSSTATDSRFFATESAFRNDPPQLLAPLVAVDMRSNPVEVM
jgi:hypothetical protein